MRRLVRAAIENSPAMNMLTIAVLVLGILSLVVMRREIFPRFELEIVLVSVPYPGASPAEVEQGICQKIEESVQSIDGIKKLYSVAAEGSGSVILELRADVKDVQRVVNEVRSEVDRIPSFPELAEDPEVQQITLREAAIRVAVMSPAGGKPDDELELRDVAEKVRDELLQLDSVSQVEILGARDYQIDIEVDESTLRKYGLSLQQVAEIIRRENLEIPGGTMRSQGQEILLRGENKHLIGQQIARLPLITDPGGAVLSVGDLAHVRDGFTDTASIQEVNDRPSLVLSVERTLTEDLLAMTAEVRDYVADRQLPGGYELLTWADRSVDVKDRLDMLINNGLIGLVLVFLVLAVFLELRLAFWVALGIPVSLLGAGAVLLLGDQTLNMLSMFSFLMALGIVVDDAIVVGENVYAQREAGKSLVQSAIDGTVEVMPSVLASVATTVIAFCPMFFVSGVMGKFIAVMPFAVIAMLMISLLESQLVLPCHLAHRDNLVFRLIAFFFYPLRFIVTFFERVNRVAAQVLTFVTEKVYLPSLQLALNHRWTAAASALAFLLCAVGFVRSGIVPFIVFPKLDSNFLQASVTFPDGTPVAVTEAAARRMVEALERVDRQLGRSPEESLFDVVYLSVGRGGEGSFGEAAPVGSQIGSVDVELVETAHRDVTSQTITAAWRKEVGSIPGVDSLTFGSPAFGPAGTPIEFKLLGPGDQVQELEEAVEKCKQRLATYPGVFDIEDDSRPGKWEYRIRVKEKAQSLGVTTADVANTIRAAYYGAEVMRLQRGRHEVKLMVRYPLTDRHSLAEFQGIYIRTADGEERLLTEVAEIDVVRGYSKIHRLDQKRSITISADVDEAQGNARRIVAALQADVIPPLLAEYPGLEVRWEGQQEQTQESVQSLLIASGAALLIMFVLLTLEFKAYLQPFMIMAIIPFGLIGAVLGHAVMGLPLTLFSFFGLVALTGVVVNDSIVLVDFINHRVRGGMPIDEALLDAGRRRVRPVLLTSATTIAGLAPILLESSFQAQVLIPMATSLSFGLMVSTLLVLMQVPVFYRIYFDLMYPSGLQPPDPEEEQDKHAAARATGFTRMMEDFLMVRMISLVSLTWAAATMLLSPLDAQTEPEMLRIGIIGLDTSHVIAFTDMINNPDAEGDLAGMRVVAGFPGGSDIPASRDRVETYTEQLRQKGIRIVDSIPELLQQVDAVLLESVDGGPHREQALPVIEAGKPLFIDKPVAGSLADAVAIYDLARQHQVPCFSSSALRFGPQIIRYREPEAAAAVKGCSTWGACSIQPPMPDLYFYGVHGVEMLFTIMGTGCKTVTRSGTDDTDLVVGVWNDGRIGSYRGIRAGKADFGAIVYETTQIARIEWTDGYRPLVEEIARFFRTGVPPVSAEETLEMFAFMEAADESLRQDGVPISLQDLLQRARDANRP